MISYQKLFFQYHQRSWWTKPKLWSSTLSLRKIWLRWESF